MNERTTLKASIGKTPYTTTLETVNHVLIGDESIEDGGQDAGPSPSEFILAGLATCTAATLRMYADRKGFALEQIHLELEMWTEKTAEGQVTHIERQIRLEGNLSEEEQQRMLVIAGKCPIHRLLTNTVEINSKLLA